MFLGLMRSFDLQEWTRIRAMKRRKVVAQISKSAVSQVSKPAQRLPVRRFHSFWSPADLEIGDTAGLETCATNRLMERD
jgi:hypothetical protein